MKVKEIKNLCVARKYTDAQGQEKTQWITIGKEFIGDDGSSFLKIDTIPAGNWWNGIVSVFEQRNDSKKPQADSQQATGQYREPTMPSPNYTDDLPF